MIKILEAKPEDAKDINNLLYMTWLDTYPSDEFGITTQDVESFLQGKFTEDSEQKRAKSIEEAENRKDKIFLVAKEGDVLVGECHGLDLGDHYQMKAFYILPEHQRKGVGKMLWEKLQEFFKEDKKIIVRVASYNQKAINFYEKLGFVKTDKDLSDQYYKLAPGKFIPEIEMVLKKE